MSTAGDPLLGAIDAICAALARFHYRFHNEAVLHLGMADALKASGIDFRHEFVAAPVDGKLRDRFDFLVGRIVIEAKIHGSLSPALRQAARYCERDDVDAVILVSTRRWKVATQIEIAGKPVRMLKIGAGL